MAVERTVVSSSLVEVVDRILDKGLVIDAFVRVSLVGIELLTIEARVVVASVDTYLRYAQAVGMPGMSQPQQLGQVITGGAQNGSRQIRASRDGEEVEADAGEEKAPARARSRAKK